MDPPDTASLPRSRGDAMSESCPHCGAHLPVASDGYCSQCGQALDESTSSPSAPERGRAGPAARVPALRYLGWFLLIAGLIGAATNPPKMRGEIEDAVNL